MIDPFGYQDVKVRHPTFMKFHNRNKCDGSPSAQLLVYDRFPFAALGLSFPEFDAIIRCVLTS